MNPSTTFSGDCCAFPCSDLPVFCDPTANTFDYDDDVTTAAADSNRSIVDFRPNFQQLDNEDAQNDDHPKKSLRSNTDPTIGGLVTDFLSLNDWEGVKASCHVLTESSNDNAIHRSDDLNCVGQTVLSDDENYHDNDVDVDGDNNNCTSDHESLMRADSLPGSVMKAQAKTYRYGDDGPAAAVLTLNWADIESEDEDIQSRKAIAGPKTAFSSRTLSKVPGEKIDGGVAFDCLWTAWYDPPKGLTGRMGIARDAYEKKLFEMGVIQCLDDFWSVHEMVDWDNMPFGSMVSFSRLGTKPFWEDPSHCHGGRWVIRGLPRNKSESLFTTVALSLFSNHFLDCHQFTCVTLQVKEKRGSNAIHLWTREPTGLHIEEIQEHICQLADGWNSDKPKRRKQGKNLGKSLQFEFFSNVESIQRNAVKLGDAVAPPTDTPVKRQKAFQIAVASRCNEVYQMCRAGRSRKKNGKANNGSRKYGTTCNGKVDCSDSLVEIGCTKPGSTKGFKLESPSPIAIADRRDGSLATKGTVSLAAREAKALSPEKSLADGVHLNPSRTAVHGPHGKQQHDSKATAVPLQNGRRSMKEQGRKKKRAYNHNHWRSPLDPSRHPSDAYRQSSMRDQQDARQSSNHTACECPPSDPPQWQRVGRQSRMSPMELIGAAAEIERLSLHNSDDPIRTAFNPTLENSNSWNQQHEGKAPIKSYSFSCPSLVRNGPVPCTVTPGFAKSHSVTTSVCPSGVYDVHGCWYPSGTISSNDSCHPLSRGNHFNIESSSTSSTLDVMGSSSSRLCLNGSSSFQIAEGKESYCEWIPIEKESVEWPCREIPEYCSPEWQPHQQYWTVGSPSGLTMPLAYPKESFPVLSSCMPYAPPCPVEESQHHYNCFYDLQDSYCYVPSKETPDHEIYCCASNSHSTEIIRLADSFADEHDLDKRKSFKHCQK